jgi:hypothetical protein
MLRGDTARSSGYSIAGVRAASVAGVARVRRRVHPDDDRALEVHRERARAGERAARRVHGRLAAVRAHGDRRAGERAELGIDVEAALRGDVFLARAVDAVDDVRLLCGAAELDRQRR